MSSPAPQPFTYLLPAYSPVHHTDPTLPTSTQIAQCRFDSDLADLVDSWELQSDNLFFVGLRSDLVLLDRANSTARWSSEQTLSGQLKTKRELQAEKDAEKELEESEEMEADGMTEVSFSEVAEDGDNEGGQLFAPMVIGSAHAWDEHAMITEQGDFWEFEEENGEMDEDEDEDEMGVV